MSWHYGIYSPMSVEEATALVGECDERTVHYLSVFPLLEESEDSASALVELSSLYRYNEKIGLYFINERKTVTLLDQIRSGVTEAIPAIVSERAVKCRSAIEIDPAVLPPEPEPALQTSQLVFLLNRVGEALFDWGDYQIEPSEQVLAAYKAKRRFEDFDDPKVKIPQFQKTEQSTAESIYQTITLLSEAIETVPDLKRWLSSLTGNRQRFIVHLLEKNPEEDQGMALALGVSLEEAKKLGKNLLKELNDMFVND